MTEDEFEVVEFKGTAKRILIDPQLLWWLEHGWDEFQEENK